MRIANESCKGNCIVPDVGTVQSIMEIFKRLKSATWDQGSGRGRQGSLRTLI